MPIAKLLQKLKLKKGPPASSSENHSDTPHSKELHQKIESLTDAREKISQGWLQLERDNSRFRGSVETLALGYIMTDDHNEIIKSNPALEKILGPGPSGKWHNLGEIQQFIDDNYDLPLSSQKCLAIRKPLPPVEVKYRFPGSDSKSSTAVNKQRFIRIFISPIDILKEAIAITGTTILIEDVTDQIVKERTREQFVAIASHELKTPLTAIRGNAEMILKQIQQFNDKNLEVMVNSIHQDTIRLVRVIDDFLNLTSLEQGKLIFKTQKFILADSIKEVLSELSVMAQSKNVSLKLEALDSLPKALADPDRVKQIVFNLISNSFKVMRSGTITVSIEEKNGVLITRVADTGTGVSEDIQQFLFQKFRHSSNEGTGIGLYVSRLIIENMGGKIYLEKTEQGKGSTFVFRLPVAK